MVVQYHLVVLFIIVVTSKADVSELNLNKTDEHHHHHEEEINHDHHQSSLDKASTFGAETDSISDNVTQKDVQDIKFSLQIILRELKFLTSHPLFDSISVQKTHQSPNNGNQDTKYSESKMNLKDVMSQVKSRLSDLDEIRTAKEQQTNYYHEPALAPPTTALFHSSPSISTVLDNFWSNDDFQSQDASQRILVAISPILRAPKVDREFIRRSKRNVSLFPLIDPLLINDELTSKTIFRREISNQNSYNYDRPSLKFEESNNKEKEYLPPLETSPANINNVKQAFSKEDGYDYKRPNKPFNLPSETAKVETVVTTTEKEIEKEYLPPPLDVEETRESVTEREYLPPLEESAASHVLTEDGYEYKVPNKPFNLPSDTKKVEKFVTTTELPISTTEKEYLPPIIDVRGSEKIEETEYLPPLDILDVKETVTEKEYLPPLEPSAANNIPQTISKEDDGYDYPKPKIGLTTPTTTRAPIIISSSTTERYIPPFESSNSDGGKLETFEPPKQKFDPINGYDYTKPTIKFPTTNLDTASANDAPTKQKYDPINGYDYAKPSIKFEVLDKDYLPPRTRDEKGLKLVNFNPIFDSLQPLNRLSNDLRRLSRRSKR